MAGTSQDKPGHPGLRFTGDESHLDLSCDPEDVIADRVLLLWNICIEFERTKGPAAMTHHLLSGGLVLTALALTASSAAAQGAPWCLSENNARGAVICSFHTFEQCLATRSGLGGSCGPNPYPSIGRYSADGSIGRRNPRR